MSIYSFFLAEFSLYNWFIYNIEYHTITPTFETVFDHFVAQRSAYAVYLR